MTPLLLPTTPCWCLTTRAAAPQRAPLAPWTPPALENRTTTTSMTGVHASKSWQTSTEEEERTEGGNSRKTERARRDNWLLGCFIEKSYAKPPSGLIISQLKFLCTLRRHREGRILPCSLLWTFATIHKYFTAFYNISRCGFFSVVLSLLSDRLEAQDGIKLRRRILGVRESKKKTSAHARFFVRFITKERSTHTFSLDLNFSRTEALLLIKCLLWCVLYRTPAISGSVAILKSFFCWAHTPPFLSAPLDYLLLSFHPCITGAKRLFDYYVENKQRKCFVKTFVDNHRTHFPFRNLILPWEIGAYEVQWFNSKNLLFLGFWFCLFVFFFQTWPTTTI